MQMTLERSLVQTWSMGDAGLSNHELRVVMGQRQSNSIQRRAGLGS